MFVHLVEDYSMKNQEVRSVLRAMTIFVLIVRI